MSQAPLCEHGEPERGIYCKRCHPQRPPTFLPDRVRIVTNGKVFRIQEVDGSFHRTWVSQGPTPWETKSYVRALKRYGAIMMARASQANEKWREL